MFVINDLYRQRQSNTNTSSSMINRRLSFRLRAEGNYKLTVPLKRELSVLGENENIEKKSVVLKTVMSLVSGLKFNSIL